jgi:seryl-tRNA synthetase
MLDLELIRQNPEAIKEATRKKQRDPVVVDEVLRLDKKRRELLQKVEDLRAERNKISSEQSVVSSQRERGREIKEELKKLEPELKEIEMNLNEELLVIPSPPPPDVPEGKDESENVEVKTWGKLPKFDFKPRAHDELGKILDVIDTERAAKVSGARFGYLKNEAVLMEFALVKLALETLTKEDFVPVIPPVMIKLEAMQGMGYLEHGGAENMFVLDKDGLVLVGTSEQSLGPMHMNEVLDGQTLPRRYMGFSTCFRREAGSYGKDTRGILRVHQFDKVEMFSFTKPEDGDAEHEFLLSMEEKLMQELKLPYQVTKMCTGDLGDPAARKYDINAWFPSENCYRETHSTSTCIDFQARRLNIKYRKKDGSTGFVHTLNGTAFSQRPILAILENYQQKDGSVVVPEVLREFVGKDVITPKNSG